MAIKDYWIYQKRETPTPWAIYVVKEFDKRGGKKAQCLDFAFYHEDVNNATHSISRVGLHYEDVRGYVDEFLSVICDYSSITNEDKEQLTKEIQDILI